MMSIFLDKLMGPSPDQLTLFLGHWGIVLFCICFIAYFVSKRLLVKSLSFIVQKTQNNWDDILFNQRVLSRLVHLVPAIICHYSVRLFPDSLATLRIFFITLTLVYMTFLVALVLDAFLDGVRRLLDSLSQFEKLPVATIIQVLRLLLFLFTSIFIVSVFLNKSPWALLGSLGAMTALIMLVFKDSILGFVASIQLSTRQLVRVGDWIEMPKYGADGTVLDISLNSVRIQNWDKTITTVPTYSLVSSSFKNWRGMSDSGVRRIKRYLYIDVHSISFCTEDDIASFSKINCLSDYITTRETDIRTSNRDNNVRGISELYGRRMTKIGVFLEYVIQYLKRDPKISQEMTFLVRQLQSTEKGLPIEIYVFCTDTVWVNYEQVQADIFDHLLASVSAFKLRLFQYSSGTNPVFQ